MGRPRTASAVARKWTVDELSRNIHRINITLDGVGDEQRVLLQSDVHNDNPHCNRDLWRQHMDEALEYDAPVLDNGDWFCAMQGKFDPRSKKDDLRPEHQVVNYLDALVETSAKMLTPYKSLLTIRGQGNHEKSILKIHETNLTERLVERLRVAGAPNIFLGGYSGFVVFNVGYKKTCHRPYKLHYFHGAGGGGPVTRGVIGTNRRAVYLADADMVWTGHTHDTWTMPIARIRLNNALTEIEHTRQEHLSTSGYKEEYADGWDGFHVEKGRAPRPTSAYWLVFKHTKHDAIDYDIIEAK